MHCKVLSGSTVRNTHIITIVIYKETEIIQQSNLPEMSWFNKFSNSCKKNIMTVYNIQLMNGPIISSTVSFVATLKKFCVFVWLEFYSFSYFENLTVSYECRLLFCSVTISIFLWRNTLWDCRSSNLASKNYTHQWRANILDMTTIINNPVQVERKFTHSE
jgi:hypothetical protein